MSSICYNNSHEDAIFWECIHFLKTYFNEMFMWLFAWNQYFLQFEWFPIIGWYIRFQEAGITAKWNVLMKTAQWIVNNANGYNLIFLCYVMNREMRNYSCFQSFSKTFTETFIWKRHSDITNKSAPAERGLDFKI